MNLTFFYDPLRVTGHRPLKFQGMRGKSPSVRICTLFYFALRLQVEPPLDPYPPWTPQGMGYG